MSNTIIAIDPGSEKIGIAVLKSEKVVLDRRICSYLDLKHILHELIAKHNVQTIVVGKGTRSKEISKEITHYALNIHIVFVDERNTTLEGRKLYWKLNPPKGLRRFIPTSLQTPSEPYDDLAAVAIGKRFFK